MSDLSPLSRASAFCDAYGLRVPILMAPMAGASPVGLAGAVADAGGMGACGALLMPPDQIAAWCRDMRTRSNGAFQLNTWVPDPPPVRDAALEGRVRAFLSDWGPEVPEDAGDGATLDFDAQCAAMVAAGPSVVSSIMGLYPKDVVVAFKARGIRWFACVTTVEEAIEAQAAGADAVVAQGAEAGGHRGTFDAAQAERSATGLFALLPAVVDAVDIPVIATGGIGDARGVAAALTLGASAVQIGTALLRSPEAATGWAHGLVDRTPHDTVVTRAFSGRPGRALRSAYTDAATEAAPYPVQRGLTAGMRTEAASQGDLQRMQAWAGQSAGLAQAKPARSIVSEIWDGAQRLLR